jgi:acetyl esterase
MGLDPHARAFLEQLKAAGAPQLHELTPEEARAATGLVTEMVRAGPQLATVEELSIPVSEGDIEGRRYVPEGAAATILWLHGGGWVICDLETHDAMCRLLAASSGCRVIAVDYRRAPEHPFPTPLEDCWDALGWVASQLTDEPLILGGDSAGANMAAPGRMPRRCARRTSPRCRRRSCSPRSTTPCATRASRTRIACGRRAFR